jgi:hypothetical protein
MYNEGDERKKDHLKAKNICLELYSLVLAVGKKTLATSKYGHHKNEQGEIWAPSIHD